MNINEFKEALLNKGLAISDYQLNQFIQYYEFLCDYNNKVNLTAITTEADVFSKHFYDSLLVMFDIPLEGTMVDVGAGAGFPSVPLKILNPELKLVLLEPINKKAEFLRQLVEKLKLDNVEVRCERSEDFALNNLDKFDLVVSRAVANLVVLTELCLPLVKVGGLFCALKGSNGLVELSEGKKAISILGGGDVKTFKHSYQEQTRINIYVKKLKETPKGYPRSFAKIKKKPLN